MEGAVEKNEEEEEEVENIKIEEVAIENEEDGPMDENVNHANHNRRDTTGRKVVVDGGLAVVQLMRNTHREAELNDDERRMRMLLDKNNLYPRHHHQHRH